jgi:hypothetical protein
MGSSIIKFAYFFPAALKLNPAFALINTKLGNVPANLEKHLTLTKTEIDLNQLPRTRARLPLLRGERFELVQRELERIMNGNLPLH